MINHKYSIFIMNYEIIPLYSLVLPLSLIIYVCVLLQFPSVSHPQTLDRRYLGIIHGLLLDLMKVKRSATFFREQYSLSNPRSCDIICC